MADQTDRRPDTAGRLLTVKQASGLGAKPPPAGEPETTDSEITRTCVNCGYSQRGQAVDRCPECGLVLASQLRDITPWNRPLPRPLAWWETAWRVCLWDRRIRLRTSFLPTTPESWSFAKWSIILSAAVLGLAIATLHRNVQLPGGLAAAYFTMQAAVSAALAAAILWVTVHALTFAVRGTWRRRLQFVPACIHYSTAWWPPLALLAFVATLLRPRLDPGDADLPLWLVVLMTLPTWGLWLWGSITESQHVSHVAARIGAVAGCLLVAGAALMVVAPGTTRRLAISFLDRTGSSLVKLNAFNTYSADPTPKSPQTLVLFIDMIPGAGEEYAIKQILEKLGGENWVTMSEGECKLTQIEKALRTAGDELRPQDRFILYINGHGDPYGSGSIQMADGYLTSQALSDRLVELQTPHCLVVIDSCFGGKFLTALDRAGCNAIVVTATDNSNVAYNTGLEPFWKALEDPKADADGDGDGQITIDEAFCSVFPGLLARGERARQQDLALTRDRRTTNILTQAGFATPQYRLLGKACREDFALRLPEKEASAQKPEEPTE